MSQSDQSCIQEPLQDHQSGPKGVQMEAQAPPRASQERPKGHPKRHQNGLQEAPRAPLKKLCLRM